MSQYENKGVIGEPEPKLELTHPELEEFNFSRPNIRFYNYAKLSVTAEAVRRYQREIISFRPSEMHQKYIGVSKSDQNADLQVGDRDNSQTDKFEPCAHEMPEETPPMAPPIIDQNIPNDPVFERIIRQHSIERFHLAEEFKKEQRQLNSNLYDSLKRDNIQKNDMVDKRPISDALRYISKKISFPIDLGGPKQYKYKHRFEKMLKKHEKAVKNITFSQRNRHEILYHSQVQEINSYCDINNINPESFRVPRILEAPDMESK